MAASARLTNFKCEAGRLYYAAIDRYPAGLPDQAGRGLGERLDEKGFRVCDMLRADSEQSNQVTWAAVLSVRKRFAGLERGESKITSHRRARRLVHASFEMYRAVIVRVYERDTYLLKSLDN
jgi:hypothetical protein